MSAPVATQTKLTAKERAHLQKAMDATEHARRCVEDAEDNLRVKRRELSDAEADLHRLHEIQGWRAFNT